MGKGGVKPYAVTGNHRNQPLKCACQRVSLEGYVEGERAAGNLETFDGWKMTGGRTGAGTKFA